MAYYIIIRGPAGVGKSTIAKKLANHLNGCYISIDGLLKENDLDKIEGKCIKKENLIKANEILVPEIIKKIDSGRIVVFDGNFYYKSQIEHLLKNLPYPYFVFTLKASLEECLSRDKTREKLGEEGIRAVYKLASKFDYGTVIDTTSKPIKGVIREIISCLP